MHRDTISSSKSTFPSPVGIFPPILDIRIFAQYAISPHLKTRLYLIMTDVSSYYILYTTARGPSYLAYPLVYVDVPAPRSRRCRLQLFRPLVGSSVKSRSLRAEIKRKDCCFCRYLELIIRFFFCP